MDVDGIFFGPRNVIVDPERNVVLRCGIVDANRIRFDAMIFPTFFSRIFLLIIRNV